MVEDDTLAAATGVVRNLAQGLATSYGPSEPKMSAHKLSATGLQAEMIILPGPDNATKQKLEQELSALAARVHYLEAKACTVNNQTLPATPNEFGTPSSPFNANRATTQLQNGSPSPPRQGLGSSRHVRVSNLLAVRESGSEGRRLFSEEDLGHLREHVQKQADEIRSQRETIASVGEQLHEQQACAERTFVKVENEDISRLQRELHKHQQANEAFQKALKEIGTIISRLLSSGLRRSNSPQSQPMLLTAT